MTSIERNPKWPSEPSAVSAWPFGIISNHPHWKERPKANKYNQGIVITLGDEAIDVKYVEPESGTPISPEKLLESGVDVLNSRTLYVGFVMYIPSLDAMTPDQKKSFKMILEETTNSLKQSSPIIIVEEMQESIEGRKGKIMEARKEFLKTQGFDGAGKEKTRRLAYKFEISHKHNSLFWFSRTKARTRRKATDLTKIISGERGYEAQFAGTERRLKKEYEKTCLTLHSRDEIYDLLSNTKNAYSALTALKDGFGRAYSATCGCRIEIDTKGYSHLAVNCGDDTCYINSPPSAYEKEDVTSLFDFPLDDVEEIPFGEEMIKIGVNEDLDFCGDCQGVKRQRRYHSRTRLKDGISEVSVSYSCPSCAALYTKRVKKQDRYILDLND